MIIKDKDEQEFKDMMDSCLESVNGEGQIKRVEFDIDSKEVKFVFKLSEYEGCLTFLEY